MENSQNNGFGTKSIKITKFKTPIKPRLISVISGKAGEVLKDKAQN